MSIIQPFCEQFHPDYRTFGLTENFFQLTTTMNYDHLFGPLIRGASLLIGSAGLWAARNSFAEKGPKSTVIFGSSWPGPEFNMEIDRVHSWSCYFYVQFLAPLASTSWTLKESWKLLSYSRGPGTQITSVRGLQSVQKFMHKLAFKMSPWKDSTFSTDQKLTSIRHAKWSTFKRLNKHKTRVWGST